MQKNDKTGGCLRFQTARRPVVVYVPNALSLNAFSTHHFSSFATSLERHFKLDNRHICWLRTWINEGLAS